MKRILNLNVWSAAAPLIVLVSSLFIASVQTQAASTNAPLKLLTREEINARWDKVPWPQVLHAAEAGDVIAQNYAGYSYSKGTRVPRDSEWMNTWFRRAADQGDPLSAMNLGISYENGDGVPRNPEAAFKLYLQAAELGLPRAQYMVACCHYNGFGTPWNTGEGDKWLRKSAEAGYAQAQSLAGYRLYDWTVDKQVDLVEAVKWYRRAADQGDADGEYRLGCAYLSSRGVFGDEGQALDLIRAAADQGHRLAMIQLGDLYATGIGEPRSEDDRPVELLLRAAKAGQREAYDGLMSRYEHGVGASQDLVEAARYYCLAWAHDSQDRDAPLDLSDIAMRKSELAARGRDDPFVTILSLYRAATQPNDLSAAAKIGELFANGHGVPRSPAKAWLWFSLAAQRGSSAARVRLAEVEPHLTADELKDARARLPALVQELSRLAVALPAQALVPGR